MSDCWSIATVIKDTKDDTSITLSFKFTINSDTSVYYIGHCQFNESIYLDAYSKEVESYQSNYFVNIVDIKKIIRDYPTITSQQLKQMTRDIISVCYSEIISNRINVSEIVFNIVL